MTSKKLFLSTLLILTLMISFAANFLTSVKASAQNYEVPTQACETSKQYPTLTIRVDKNNALNQGLLLIDCAVEFEFPVITAGPEYETPIGQFTIDYAFIKKNALLSWEEKGYKNLKTPNWMPYYLDTNSGDFGPDIWRNNFGVHGAPWRYTNEFNGKMPVVSGGTHGCTNLNNYSANWIWNFVQKTKKAGSLVKVYNYR
jgi:L,D-transpeptidase catalytic domain